MTRTGESQRPAWRRAYDAVERVVAPLAEELVHTNDFVKATSTLLGLRRALGQGINEGTLRMWNLFNLPAATDVRRLRTQLGALDRDVRRLSIQFERYRDEPKGD